MQILQPSNGKSTKSDAAKVDSIPKRVTKLKLVMAEKNIKNKDLAEHLDKHPVQISYLVTGERMEKLRAKTLFQIASFLGVEPADVYGYTDDETETVPGMAI